jgi:hypothetical protein
MAFFDNNAFQKTFSSGDQAVMMVASKNRFFGLFKPDFWFILLYTGAFTYLCILFQISNRGHRSSTKITEVIVHY